jgi:pimeloyl-ACP methyl ester carboxylesterase
MIIIPLPRQRERTMTVTQSTAPTQYVEVDGDRFAYRRWGSGTDVPIVLIQHFRGGMDHWDPLLTDGLATAREVILVNGRGVASSSGTPRNLVADMADDLARVLTAIGVTHADVLGFSLGGYVAQDLTRRHPALVRKLVLVGTGPRGGDPAFEPRVLEVAPRPVPTVDDFLFLFFGRSEAAVHAGRAFWDRRHLRPDQDPPSSPEVAQAQIESLGDWLTPVSADEPFAHLREIRQPTLVVNGTNDVMIATINSWHLSQNIPDAQLVVYPDAGHGAHFQYPQRFLRHLTQFLEE